MKNHGAKTVSIFVPSYPYKLLALHGKQILLYVKADTSLLRVASISIAGLR